MSKALTSNGLGLLALTAVVALAGAPARAQDLKDLKDTPFAYGDDFPEVNATCENVRSWAGKAPDTHVRFNMAVRGKLSRVAEDSALVQLTMCQAPELKVTCITYKTNGMAAGDVVTFVGGFRQPNSEHVVLDPCLASRD
jgi:hypothetical protein